CVATMVTCSTFPPAPPTPGPEGLMIRLLPLIAKTPPAFEYGDPKPSVPVNGWPLLQEAMIVATVAPNGVVLGIEGLGGWNDKLRTGAVPVGVNSTST